MYSRSAKGGEKGDPNRNPWLAKMMTCMHDVNNCLQFVFVMSISDQTVSSKLVIFDRKIVLGQNTIHKDCISNNKERFSAESKYPLASILCCHV